ncbi:MAG: DUF1559 domain-containing protein [Gemmataceae bacterium]|nr:DUF1559 domain-containing protein [Gemmataceae bacterium]
MRLTNPPRAGVSRLEAIVVVHLVLLAGLLLIPACQRHVREPAACTQSTNNLKQIALSFHSFHDLHKRLPFNGTKAAVAGEIASGSWAFQILPLIDQELLFNKPDATTTVYSYICPGRGRPSTQAGLGA